VRIALLGSGWVQKFHAQAVLEHPRGELVAAANWRPESVGRLAERFDIPVVTTRWQDLVADPGIEAVVIATPNALHAPQAIACLEAGKHVLVEKPMAASVAECDAMIESARASSVALMIAHCWRWHERVRSLRARVAAGVLGEVVKTRGYGIHVGWGPSGWFTDRALSAGGALVDMGVHAIDTARFLLGEPLPEHVHARVRTRYGSYNVDDDAVLLISWSNGTVSTIEAGWWQPHAGGLEAETEVYGTAGYAQVFPFAEAPPGYEHCTQPMYSAQMAAFIDAVTEGREPRPNGEDGRVVVGIVEEAYRSARESQSVNVDD
jgi:predicted dehydrogenase